MSRSEDQTTAFTKRAVFRLHIVLLLALALAVGVSYKAFVIQIVGNDRLKTLAQKQFHSNILVSPSRGIIYDRGGEPLATNISVSSLAVNPNKVKNKKEIAKKISRALKIPVNRVLKKITNKREFVWIKRHVTEKEFIALKKQGFFVDKKMQNLLWLVKESQRTYPHGELASHVLGDVNIDSVGIEGIELVKNSHLRGEVVSVAGIKDAFGRATFIDAKKASLSKNGNQLYLTIDASLQFEAEKLLKTAVKEVKARSGSVVVMDAETGEILVMANYPTFDPGKKAVNVANRRNRILTDGFEPGSTIKPLLVASALSSGWSTKKNVWAGNGKVKIQGRTISEAESHEKFKWLSLKDIIQVSSNVAAANLALEIGSEKFISTLSDFGFGKKTKIDFPGEISGWLPKSNAKIQPLSLATMGFGQGFVVSALQVVRAYAAILNGGWLVQPHLIKNDELRTNIHRPKKVLNQDVTNYIQNALLSVTQQEGTAHQARLDGFRVAGKTGTAQVVDPKTKKYSKTRYISSFVGFALDVEPKLVTLTVIDGAKKGSYYASQNAAPLFKKVLSAAVNHFDLKGDVKKAELLRSKKLISQWEKQEQNKDQVKWTLSSVLNKKDKRISRLKRFKYTNKNGQSVWIMPNLKGISIREALKLLEGHDFAIEAKGFGFVASQFPREGMKIADKQKVKLYLKE